MRRKHQGGFTLIELLITITIIGILTAIAVVKYANTIRKTQEGATKANLGMIRSSLSIYFGDNDGSYPTDDLTVLTENRRYLATMPFVHSTTDHSDTIQVITETTVSDSGKWSYNNTDTDALWGKTHVGCSHDDSAGRTWSNY